MKIRHVLILFFLFVNQANGFWGIEASIAKIVSSSKALSSKMIIRLSDLSGEMNGTLKAGKKLSKLNLPNDVLEDTYLRIAIHQKKITRKQAESMYIRLTGTPGFRTTLRKITGNNVPGTAGHLNELQIADKASLNGFKVKGIGVKFNDGQKKALTDIDIVLKKNSNIFAIEAKNYASTSKIPLDKYRADLDTLAIYRSQHSQKVIPVFTMTNIPQDSGYLKIMQNEANKRDVQLIFGSPHARCQPTCRILLKLSLWGLCPQTPKVFLQG